MNLGKAYLNPTENQEEICECAIPITSSINRHYCLRCGKKFKPQNQAHRKGSPSSKGHTEGAGGVKSDPPQPKKKLPGSTVHKNQNHSPSRGEPGGGSNNTKVQCAPEGSNQNHSPQNTKPEGTTGNLRGSGGTQTRQRFAKKNSLAKKKHHKLTKTGMVSEFNSHPAETFSDDFDLSEKIYQVETDAYIPRKAIDIRDVKEFIKRVLECPMGIRWEDWIEKLAGKNLSGDGE